MLDDQYSVEKMPGGKLEREQRGEYADIWENADMSGDAPEFSGEDPYAMYESDEAEDGDGEMETTEEVNGAESEKSESRTEAAMNGKFGGAEKLTSYGLDTAARMYGLGAVFKAIKETDQTGSDAYNPMHSIFEKVAPNPEERANLFGEIRKDDSETKQFERKDDEREDIDNAIAQMKTLMNALENDPRFEDLRKRAADDGVDVTTYLTSNLVNPTLSDFFNGLNSATGGNVEQILNEIEAEEKGRQEEEKMRQAEELYEEFAKNSVGNTAGNLGANEVGLDPGMLR